MIKFTLTLFSSFLYSNALDVLIILLTNFFFCLLVQSSLFRKKVCAFLGLLFVASVFCFYISFDGVAILLISSELLVILLLVVISLTSNINVKNYHVSFISFQKLFSILFFFYLVSLSYYSSSFIYNTKDVYLLSHEVYSSDLFIFFFTFFLTNPSFVYFLTLLLSLFSLFFILFFFELRYVTIKLEENALSLYILRKQKIPRQAKHSPQVRTFNLICFKKVVFQFLVTLAVSY